MKLLIALVAVCTVFTVVAAAVKSLTDIPFKDMDGKETSLKAYEGKAILVVNVASKCGFTKQYSALEKLYRDHKDKGLVIIGFPCNDFGGQEPGTLTEIKEFCTKNFDVTFPLMDKVHVKGKEQHPLYAALTGKEAAFPGDVKWNFGKFLISRDGQVLQRFGSTTKPDDEELVKAVEAALKK